MLIGIATGDVTLSEFVKFGLEIRASGLVHYRKIIDVLDARPAFSEQELLAIAKLVREAQFDRKRGAVAFVADPERGQFARIFANLDIDGRPAQVFRSIHDARKWIAEHPAEAD